MAEGVREAVPLGRADYRNLVAHRLDHLDRVGAHRAEVQQQVEQREFDLADDEQPGLKMPRLDHAVEQVAGQERPGRHMSGHAGQHLAVPGEIFHQLARQLDRIPFEAVGAGDIGAVDAGEQQMKHMPRLMQQRRHVVVAEQRRRRIAGGREVADEEGDRHGMRVAVVELRAGLAHPRAAALARAGVEVKVHAREHRPALVGDVDIARVGMVERHVVALDQGDAEQPAEQRLPAREHALDREIGADLLLVDRVARQAQAVRGEADVPGLQVGDAELAGRERFQFGEISVRGGLRAAGEIA